MKRINKLFLLLLCACLSLASCTGSRDKQPEKMCGEWVHVKGHPSFTLSETDGKYSVTRKSNIRGKVLETTYQVTERDGNLFIETVFAILLSYDKERDRITLSPGGEYKRVTNPKNKAR